jgi:hypothetical protein
MVDCGPLAGSAVDYTQLWDAAAAFLHNVTFNTTMSLAERRRSGTAAALLRSFNVPRNMLSLATSSMQSLGRFYRNKSLESVIGVLWVYLLGSVFRVQHAAASPRSCSEYYSQ